MWLISYQYIKFSKDDDGKIHASEPADRIALIYEHPAVAVAECLMHCETWEHKPPTLGLAQSLDTASIIRRIYSAIEIPDDLVLENEQLRFLRDHS